MRNFILASSLLLASSALAQQPTLERRYGGFPGKDELSAEMGVQASLGGTTPGGFKLFFDYSHRLGQLVWLDFKVNPVFGVGNTPGTCYDAYGNAYDCYGAGVPGNGYAVDLLAGVKLKWMTRFHVMPYCNINGGVVPVFARPNGDNGAAIVLNTGGGVKYFVTPRIAVGGEMNVTLGPGFYGSSNYRNSHDELYRAFNLAVGAEFIL